VPVDDSHTGAALEFRLAGFAACLREAGLPLSTIELLDALQALQNIDISSKVVVKTALQATLVKNHGHQEPFDRLFEAYFIVPELQSSRAQEEVRRREKLDMRLQEAARSLQFKGETLRLSGEEMRLYTSLPEEQRQGLLHFVRQTEEGKNVERTFRPLLETVVKGHLRFLRGQMRQTEPTGGEGGDGIGSSAGDNRIRQVDIQSIRSADLPAAEALIHKLSQQLARRLARRRRASRRGPLDLRRSIRDNMRFGGSIFLLRHRRKRPQKQQLLLICDVSASMQRYSVFVLQFMYGLQTAVQNLESFSFSDSLEYLSPTLQKQDGLQKILDRVVKGSNNWGGGTNLASALQQLLGSYRFLLNRKTIVIIVSDTKTIALDPSLQALKRLQSRVKEILWLNPLVPEQWPLYQSVGAIQQLVEMWPCHNIDQLEAVVAGRFIKDRKQYYTNQEGGVYS
jgi:uncharacterized protein